MLHPEIIPTILATNDDEYHTKLTAVEDLVTRVQIDIMDGELVPQTTIGAPTIEGYATQLSRDIHLMVRDPLAHLAEYSRVGVDHLIFPVEAVSGENELKSVIEEIKSLGNRVGLSFDLETPLGLLDQVAEQLDLIQLMSVLLGYGAQNFEKEVLPRILAVRERYPELPLAVDGGIDLENIKQVQDSGANLFLIGSHLFSSESIKEYLERLREKIR